MEEGTVVDLHLPPHPKTREYLCCMTEACTHSLIFHGKYIELHVSELASEAQPQQLQPSEVMQPHHNCAGSEHHTKQTLDCCHSD